MTPASTLDPSAVAPAAIPAPRGRRVTDAPTRLAHWLLALTFVGAYLTAESEHWRALHVTLGYTFGGVAAFRVLYGLLGPRQARLGALGRKLATVPSWVRSLNQGSFASVNWRQGQHLLMAVAIAAVLLFVAPLVLSGYATYADWGGEWLEEVHEFVANALLAAVLLHVGLIAALSAWRRTNLARPMLTGRIEGSGPDLVRHERRCLAALLLIAVLAFGAWQWQQAPRGLLPASGWTSGESSHDDA